MDPYGFAANFGRSSNRGVQIAANYGSITTRSDAPPMREQTRSRVMVPYPSDENFVDRDDMKVDGIVERMSRPGRRLAICGLGGMGKTQLAIEYAWRIAADSPSTWIFWVSAHSTSHMIQDYEKIAKAIGIEIPPDNTQAIFQLVHNWMESEKDWILILDNTDNHDILPSLEKGFLPRSAYGRILVTSREIDEVRRFIGEWSAKNVILLEEMSERQALVLFSNIMSRPIDDLEAAPLMRYLDYIPMAIIQAAAYISMREERLSPNQYLLELQWSERERSTLLKEDLDDRLRGDRAQRSIIATLQLTFKSVRAKRPTAMRLLSLMSFFDRHCIQEYLVGRPSRVQGDSRDQRTIKDDITLLKSYCLIRITGNGDVFEMHRLTQFAAKEQLALDQDLESYKEKYIFVVWICLTWAGKIRRSAILPHAELILKDRPKHQAYLRKCVDIAEIVLRDVERVDLARSKNVLRESLCVDALTESTSLDNHKRLFMTGSLASVIRDGGRLRQSQVIFEKLLEDCRSSIGTENLLTLVFHLEFAELCIDQKKFTDAEKWSRSAITGFLKLQRKTSERNADLQPRKDLGKLPRAFNLWMCAASPKHHRLPLPISIFACDIPEVDDNLRSVLNTIWLEWWMRTTPLSEPLTQFYHRTSTSRLWIERTNNTADLVTLSIFEKVRKTDDENMSTLFARHGQFVRSKTVLQAVLEHRKSRDGFEHPATLETASKLVQVLRELGELREGERLQKQIISARGKLHAVPDHPATLTAIEGLAIFQSLRKDFAGAERSLCEVIGKRLEGPGVDSDNMGIVEATAKYADLMRLRHCYGEASLYYSIASNGFAILLGEGHPTTQDCFLDHLTMLAESGFIWQICLSIARRTGGYKEWGINDDLAGLSMETRTDFHLAPGILIEGIDEEAMNMCFTLHRILGKEFSSRPRVLIHWEMKNGRVELCHTGELDFLARYPDVSDVRYRFDYS